MDVLPTLEDVTTKTIKLRTKKVIKEKVPEIEKKKESKKLKKKLQEISERNETLAHAINEKNFEIAELKRSVKSLNEVLNSVPIDEMRCNSSIASTKILDLSKKNRQLRAELELTKNKISSKEGVIKKLERDLKSSQQKNTDVSDAAKKGLTNEMQSKLNALKQKLFETRNKNVELQNQLKLAQKCIQQEVGESFNLNILASNGSNSNWRGRAQQIIHLQQKIQELKERLELLDPTTGVERRNSLSCTNVTAYESEPPVSTNMTINETGFFEPAMNGSRAPSVAGSVATSVSTHAHTQRTSTTAYDRFTPTVRKSEILHRNKVDLLQREIEDLKQQLEDQRSKILALKVRNKTLHDDVIQYKIKTSHLENQTDFNDLSLSSISEKLNAQKCQYEKRIKEIERKVTDVEKERSQVEFREEELKHQLEEMHEVLLNKDQVIYDQALKIDNLEKDMKSICGGFLFKCRAMKKEDYMALLDSLETEKNHLLAHNAKLNERIQRERATNENLADQLAKKKINISRLEAKIRDLEKEIEVLTDRKKRTQRITDYANSITSLNNNVGSFVFENLTPSVRNSKEEISQTKVEDMKLQLDYANEKIALLEQKIANIIEEKEHDLQLFQEAVVNSKYRIVEDLQSCRTVDDEITSRCS